MYQLCDLTKPQTFMAVERLTRYSVIVADPPWWYADQRKVRKDGKTPTRGIGACHHYKQLKTPAIAAMKAPPVMASLQHCYLFMWATCPLLFDAQRVIEAWGFRYSTVAFVWIKTNSGRWQEAQAEAQQVSLWPPSTAYVERFLDGLCFFGPGHHSASNVELVLLGIKGSAPSPAKGRKVSQLIFAPQDEHSRKPEQLQDRIEWMYPFYARGEMCELFARRERLGWDCYGNENIFPPYPAQGT
jgi:N6-adenosine-specific RNA methylase IME4